MLVQPASRGTCRIGQDRERIRAIVVANGEGEITGRVVVPGEPKFDVSRSWAFSCRRSQARSYCMIAPAGSGFTSGTGRAGRSSFLISRRKAISPLHPHSSHSQNELACRVELIGRKLFNAKILHSRSVASVDLRWLEEEMAQTFVVVTGEHHKVSELWSSLASRSAISGAPRSRQKTGRGGLDRR